jgi:DNA-binding MurR/RpiR family transcriptional regulator
VADPIDTPELIRAHRDELSPAERRVADVVVADPQFVAFGTVAELAERAGTSGASVVRLATRLGLDGFGVLQERVRTDLTHHLHQASERIQRPDRTDLLAHTAGAVAESLSGTLGAIRRADFDGAVDLLADEQRTVFVLASDASRGIGQQFATELAMVRRGVVHLDGSPVAVHRALADLERGDVLVVLDLPRYDRWVLDAAAAARTAGSRVVSLTDSQLSPLATGAEFVFVVRAGAAGPFDSHVASLAVFESLVAGVAHRRRKPAAAHLARIESAWTDADVLADE